MEFDIQERGIKLNDSMVTYLKERINSTLGNRYNQIQRITVQLGKINRPLGKINSLCHVRITLPRLKDIVIEDIQSDIYVAIFRATDRVSRTVNRRLARLHDKKRKLFVPHKSNQALLMDGGFIQGHTI